jgi:Glycosyltransferase family 9 (heptosyltransferase)
MGAGDDIMASGMARGAQARGRRIAFGDRRRILWGPYSEIVFRHNPNVAPPGSERDPDIEWIEYYKGHRLYNQHSATRWVWNYDYKAVPGQLFFSSSELTEGQRFGQGFILIEPNVPQKKSVAHNKTWPLNRYQQVASSLKNDCHRRILQFDYDGAKYVLASAKMVRTNSLRDAYAILSNAALYIGPEGGLHHAAAALGVPAVVIFGGFIPPQVTGYDFHINLTGGAQACGSLQNCAHCLQAMDRITAEDVLHAAELFLKIRLVG